MRLHSGINGHDRALLVVAVALGAIVAQASAQDYPQWRGVTRDGSASTFREPQSWPDSLTRRWRVEVGDGYATPLVVGRTVYVFSRRDGNEVMHALDASTGAKLWQSGYPAPYSPSQAAAAHGAGPKATPLYYQGRLFTLGISGIVAAFDADTGRALWRTDPPAEHPFFSAASSPVGDNGLIFTHPGNYGPVTAFDAASGAVKWSAGAGGFFQSPLVVTLGGIRQIVTVTQKSVIGVSVPKGELLWEFPFPGGAGGTMPVLHGDHVIVSALDVGVTCFKPTRRDGKWTVESVWETKDVSMYISNPVVVGDTLFGLSRRNGGQFFALDAKTGAVLWLGPPRAAETAAFVKAGDLLFILRDDGELIVARASRTEFTPLKRYTVADSATWAQPAISGSRMYIKDVSSLSLWSFE